MKRQALRTATAMNLMKLAAAVMMLPCSIMDIREVRPIPVTA